MRRPAKAWQLFGPIVDRQETHYNSSKPGWQLTATAVEGARDLGC